MLLNIKTNNDNSFIISGVLAVSFYLFCFILFLLYISTPKTEKYDAVTKNTVLELDILITKDLKKDLRNKTDSKDTEKAQEIVKKSKSITAKAKTSVKSLFANVKTQSKKVIEKEVLNVKKSEVSSRFKAKFEKQRKTNVSVSKLLDNVKTKASVMPSSDSNNKNDPYFSKIYELLAQRWTPMRIIDELSAKVLVIITNDGEFDYRFITNSSNQTFNRSLEEFLEEQKLVTYPTHNKGRVTRIEVIFKAKG